MAEPKQLCGICSPVRDEGFATMGCRELSPASGYCSMAAEPLLAPNAEPYDTSAPIFEGGLAGRRRRRRMHLSGGSGGLIGVFLRVTNSRTLRPSGRRPTCGDRIKSQVRPMAPRTRPPAAADCDREWSRRSLRRFALARVKRAWSVDAAEHPSARTGGAPGRTRTSTVSPPTDFESAASTNSATGAGRRIISAIAGGSTSALYRAARPCRCGSLRSTECRRRWQ